MSVKVMIPTPLRVYAGKRESADVAAATVGEALAQLTTQFGDLRKHLFTEDGKLRSFVNVYVNDEDIRYLAKENTPTKDGDTVSIVPSIAGGSSPTKIQSPATQPASGTGKATTLTNEEILRYSRHLIMPEVGMEGQLKLKNSKVLLIGTGGLGAPLGLYLAAAGVGHLGLVDFDVVDFTNLQRQVTFGSDDVGKPKTAAAQSRLSNLNPDIKIETFETKLTSENALDLFKDFDIIVDGTDNFPTRYLVNDACILLGKPNVYGSIFRFEGQVTVFGMPDGPCYRCLYPEPPPPGLVPSCAEGGVLGVLPGIVGSIQAMETIKLILGAGDSLKGPLAALRRPGHEVSRTEAAQKSRLPHVRRSSHHHQAHRLLRILRRAWRRSACLRRAGSRNHPARSENSPRPRRRSFHSRCARAARISNLQSPRPLDPSRRTPAPRPRTRLFPRNRRSLPQRKALRRSRRLFAKSRFP